MQSLNPKRTPQGNRGRNLDRPNNPSKIGVIAKEVKRELNTTVMQILLQLETKSKIGGMCANE